MIKIWKKEDREKEIKKCEVCGKLIKLYAEKEILCGKCRVWKLEITKDQENKSQE